MYLKEEKKCVYFLVKKKGCTHTESFLNLFVLICQKKNIKTLLKSDFQEEEKTSIYDELTIACQDKIF